MPKEITRRHDWGITAEEKTPQPRLAVSPQILLALSTREAVKIVESGDHGLGSIIAMESTSRPRHLVIRPEDYDTLSYDDIKVMRPGLTARLRSNT